MTDTPKRKGPPPDTGIRLALAEALVKLDKAPMPAHATTIKIEKGILLCKEPVSVSYPFGDMESGDSFAIPGTDAQTVRRSITYQHKKTKRRFKTRTQPDGTLRVWRVS